MGFTHSEYKWKFSWLKEWLPGTMFFGNSGDLLFLCLQQGIHMELQHRQRRNQVMRKLTLNAPPSGGIAISIDNFFAGNICNQRYALNGLRVQINS